MNSPKLSPLADSIIPLQENLFAPEIFASRSVYFTFSSGVVTITFVSFRLDSSISPAKQKAVVTLRVTMPVTGAQDLAASLYDFLKKNNLDPVPLPLDPQQIQ